MGGSPTIRCADRSRHRKLPMVKLRATCESCWAAKFRWGLSGLGGPHFLNWCTATLNDDGVRELLTRYPGEIPATRKVDYIDASSPDYELTERAVEYAKAKADGTAARSMRALFANRCPDCRQRHFRTEPCGAAAT